MSKVLENKQKVIDQIIEKFSNSKSTIITDYRGLNVKQANELRKQLRAAGVQYHVLKNTLTRRATEKIGLSEVDQHLTGPTAVAFSNEDVIAPAKILYNFSKTNQALEIKGGIVEGRFVDFNEIKSLAELPSRDGLLSMLLSVLQAPMRNLALVVKAVAEKDGTEASAAE